MDQVFSLERIPSTFVDPYVVCSAALESHVYSCYDHELESAVLPPPPQTKEEFKLDPFVTSMP